MFWGTHVLILIFNMFLSRDFLCFTLLFCVFVCLSVYSVLFLFCFVFIYLFLYSSVCFFAIRAVYFYDVIIFTKIGFSVNFTTVFFYKHI